MPVFGPGTLKIGSTGSEIDISCLVNNVTLSASPTTADPTTKLCGTQRQGATKYACTLKGNIDIDPDGTTSLFCLSWATPGIQEPFEFIPDTDDGSKATGTLVVQPLDFGSSGTYGDDLTSDFEFQVLWKPVITCSGAGPDKGSASNGDVFPTEPTITASDSTNAAKLAGLGYVASPTTAWTTGQKITVNTFLFNWSGTAWAAGAHA